MSNSGKSRLSRRRGQTRAARAHAVARQGEEAAQRRRDWSADSDADTSRSL